MQFVSRPGVTSLMWGRVGLDSPGSICLPAESRITRWENPASKGWDVVEKETQAPLPVQAVGGEGIPHYM